MTFTAAKFVTIILTSLKLHICLLLGSQPILVKSTKLLSAFLFLPHEMATFPIMIYKDKINDIYETGISIDSYYNR